jgi:type 1 glutamine amidotransferase
MYGKGRVYYSTLGHLEQNWDDPRLQKMYLEAITWAMGLVNADVNPRPLPTQSGKTGNQRPNIHSAWWSPRWNREGK